MKIHHRHHSYLRIFLLTYHYQHSLIECSTTAIYYCVICWEILLFLVSLGQVRMRFNYFVIKLELFLILYCYHQQPHCPLPSPYHPTLIPFTHCSFRSDQKVMAPQVIINLTVLLRHLHVHPIDYYCLSLIHQHHRLVTRSFTSNHFVEIEI